MKKYLIVIMLIILTAGCSEDYLEREPLDIIASSSVFEDESLTEAYLYKVYSYLPQGYGDVSSGYGFRFVLASVTDESRSKSGWVDANDEVVAGHTRATKNVLGNWSHLYRGIRRANNIISSLESSSLKEEFKSQVSAEARYLRAWMYFDLTRRYGDVPLIKEVQGLDDDLLVSQTPRAEIYNFINEELEAIAPNIPFASDLDSGKLGRINRETVWSLSSRINLYAQNYVKAAAAARKVLDESPSGFTLNSNLDQLFQSDGGDSEVIFEVLNQVPFKGHNWDMLNLPFSLKSFWGSQTNPTQELVNAYEMVSTGLPITDPASGYDANNPYFGRDKRFYATIAYNGSLLKGKTLDMIFPNGEDAPLKTGLHTITGYYIKKFIDESLPFGPNAGESKVSWKEFRLAEVLLNYAEAKNEASGPDASIYSALNQIRLRAGLPNLPEGLSKTELRDRIRQERRVELAFENHRYFDLIRWGIAEQVLHDKYFKGMKVIDDGSGNLSYNIYEVNFRPKQVFLPKNYLMPIPQGEIEKNPNLIQNAGY